MDPEQAVQDFHARRANYKKVYEPVSERDGSFVKIINSKQFIVNAIRGYLPLKVSTLLCCVVLCSGSLCHVTHWYRFLIRFLRHDATQVVHFVMNLHTLPRTFYLTRHGQSEYNLLGKIGGDSGLTPAGVEYARRLAQFAKEHIAGAAVNSSEKDNGQDNDDNVGKEGKVERPCRLWTSTLRRTKETAQFIEHNTFDHTFDNGEFGEWVQFRRMPRRNLDELYAGVCDGMTYKEIEDVYPEEFARRQQDKLAYRYPRGMESLLHLFMFSSLVHSFMYQFIQANRIWTLHCDWNHWHKKWNALGNLC